MPRILQRRRSDGNFDKESANYSCPGHSSSCCHYAYNHGWGICKYSTHEGENWPATYWPWAHLEVSERRLEAFCGVPGHCTIKTKQKQSFISYWRRLGRRWGKIFVDYKVQFPISTFQKDSLKDYLCHSLKDMKSSVNNLEDGTGGGPDEDLMRKLMKTF